MKKAFTMIELVFVIVVIGILAAVAVPRFAATRNDAVITAAKSTVAAVRASIATQRQMRTLRGEFDPIDSLNVGGGAFSTFGVAGVELKDADDNPIYVLEGTIPTCAAGQTGCWASGTQYLMPGSGTAVDFTLSTGGRFDCTPASTATDDPCRQLTQ
jgi:general secretion pathway protein G